MKNYYPELEIKVSDNTYRMYRVDCTLNMIQEFNPDSVEEVKPGRYDISLNGNRIKLLSDRAIVYKDNSVDTYSIEDNSFHDWLLSTK